MKNIKIHLFTGAQCLLAFLAGSMLTIVVHNEIVGDVLTLGLLAGIWLFDRQLQRARQRIEHQARATFECRLAARVTSELERTLATSHFTVVQTESWPVSRLLDWPETPCCPAPVQAWDITVQVHDGSRGTERLTVYVDATMYVLPAVSSDEQESVPR